MLAIVVGCEKFDQYIYRQITNLYCMSIKKSLHTAPKWLQRMLLRLQKYDIELIYKRGEEVHIANALSRAYSKIPLNVDEKTEFSHQVEDLIQTGH